MAELDVSDAFGIENMDLFDVIRREEQVDSNGEAETVESPIYNVPGVVTNANPDDLERLPEYDSAQRHICVVTQFRLRGPAERLGREWKPDLVKWLGDFYVVKTIDPYPHFGQGFVQVIAGSVDSIEQPPA